MKNNLLKSLVISICFALSLGLLACASNEETEEEAIIVEKYSKEVIAADPKGAEYEHFFESVEVLSAAMKKAPDLYNNATIKVIGTIAKKDGKCLLVDYTITSSDVPNDLYEEFQLKKRIQNQKNIEIIIANDAQYAVAEDGDYVKLYGTLRLTRGAIYVDSCEYALIATLDERIEMTSK